MMPTPFEFDLPALDNEERRITSRHASLLPHEAFHCIYTKVQPKRCIECAPGVLLIQIAVGVGVGIGVVVVDTMSG